MSETPILVVMNGALRLADHPALHAASQEGCRIIPVVTHPDIPRYRWNPGAASRWWLHRSLEGLSADLAERGSRLVVRKTDLVAGVSAVARESGARAVYWNRRHEPGLAAQDDALQRALAQLGVEANVFSDDLLHDPDALRTKGGTPFKVFTPFWKAFLRDVSIPEPLPGPKTLLTPKSWPVSDDIADLGLLPSVPWYSGMAAAWEPGEAGASKLLDRFAGEVEALYDKSRDRPDEDGTSRLSPHLHFGEVSPRQVWHAVLSKTPDEDGAVSGYLRQLVWGEFSMHLLVHEPHTAEQPLRAEFGAFPWQRDAAAELAWQEGRTGYPYIDAGMRQLWATGWMHNRVRMAVASFLVKHLLISWQDGARWFWDTLVDADLANNTMGWQWTAGCGADAAPYFRIFNPIAQGEKFDPDGAYVRRWVPELARLDAKYIHRPWVCPPVLLAEAGVTLGDSYPYPIVDHGEARARALAAYETIKLARA